MLLCSLTPQAHYPWFPRPLTRNLATGQKAAAAAAPLTISQYPLLVQRRRAGHGKCNGRRGVRYGGGEEEDENYGHNTALAMLESYTESARNEALLVRATVDDEEEEVLIFKGFSSCLSSRTAPDPTKSVLPAKAVIQSIDVIEGPFDPSNIEYLEKGLTWEAFKPRLQSRNKS